MLIKTTVQPNKKNKHTLMIKLPIIGMTNENPVINAPKIHAKKSRKSNQQHITRMMTMQYIYKSSSHLRGALKVYAKITISSSIGIQRQYKS